MFANTRAFSGFAVDDIEAAKKFYGDTLGLRTSEQYGLRTLHLAGDRNTRRRAGPPRRLAGEIRRPGPGREGHQPGRRPVHRLVQGPGRKHPGRAAGALDR